MKKIDGSVVVRVKRDRKRCDYYTMDCPFWKDRHSKAGGKYNLAEEPQVVQQRVFYCEPIVHGRSAGTVRETRNFIKSG